MAIQALIPYALGALGAYQGYRSAKESGASGIGRLLGAGLGGFGGGSTLTADSGNFSVRYPNQQQPQVVDPGRPASGGIQGGISGAAQGFLASGFNPLGAVVGGIGGLFG